MKTTTARLEPSRMQPVSVALIVMAVALFVTIIVIALTQRPPTAIRAAHKQPIAEIMSLYMKGDYEKAIPRLKAYLAKGKGDIPLARDLLISSYWQIRNYKAAFEQLKIAAQAKPNDADNLFRLGLLADQLGQPERAVGYLEKAASIKPDQPQFQAKLTQVLTRLRKSRDDGNPGP